MDGRKHGQRVGEVMGELQIEASEVGVADEAEDERLCNCSLGTCDVGSWCCICTVGLAGVGSAAVGRCSVGVRVSEDDWQELVRRCCNRRGRYLHERV